MGSLNILILLFRFLSVVILWRRIGTPSYYFLHVWDLPGLLPNRRAPPLNGRKRANEQQQQQHERRWQWRGFV